MSNLFQYFKKFNPLSKEVATGAVKRALENTFTDVQVQLQLTFDPPWSHVLISEVGQNFLNQ